MPQPLGSPGGQLGMGIALVLEMLTVVLAEETFAEVVAIAPVKARAMTRVRTIIFMVWLPFGYSK
jgi:LDH2 family malate/lactate/ureidoglycolate dehydrogenase